MSLNTAAAAPPSLTNTATSAPTANDHAMSKRESRATLWFLRFCTLLSFSALLANALGVLGNLVLASGEDAALALALRFYAALLCALCAFAELEWRKVLTVFGFLESWVGRGLASIFNGLLLLTKTEGGGGGHVLQRVSGNALLYVGLVYLCCGIACLHRIKESHLNKQRKRDEVRKEKAELESRKHEIEALLRDTESQLEKI